MPSIVGVSAGGLTNIRDRVVAVGGHLRVEDAPGGGTRIAADLPLAGSMTASAGAGHSRARDTDGSPRGKAAHPADSPLPVHPVGSSRA
jgi:hypothetical protein